jgi:hypothetical protein
MGTKRVWSAASGVWLLMAVALMVAIAAPAAAATPSEMLQKAIYTEETVGDLDAAMKLYEKVIAEGKSASEAAAQAQFRLALCLEKKGRDAEAQAAFKAVIENFPNSKELVAQAREHLPSDIKLLPAPWKMGERMQLGMMLPSGLNIGTMIYMVDAAERDGKPITRCSTRGVVTINGALSNSWVECDIETFKPFESLWKHTLLGEATAKYGDTSATITTAGRQDPFTLDFTPPAFDNEQACELFRRLPLEVGFKKTITIVTSLGGSVIPLGLEVTGKETITVPAGTFECYKMNLSIGQTFYVSTDEHRYVVRFVAGGVSADLIKVWQADPNKGETLSGDGFSLALPPNWLAYEQKQDEPGRYAIVLLDPNAIASSEMGVRPTSSLNESDRKSTKAWTESFIGKMKKRFGDFQLSETGFVETKVGGHAATQIVADFTDNGKPARMFGVAVIGDQAASTLSFTAPADKFDELRPQFEAVVKGFEIQ